MENKQHDVDYEEIGTGEWMATVQDYMETMLRHSHCIRCQFPMMKGEQTRDGVCLTCKKKEKEAKEKLNVRPII